MVGSSDFHQTDISPSEKDLHRICGTISMIFLDRNVNTSCCNILSTINEHLKLKRNENRNNRCNRPIGSIGRREIEAENGRRGLGSTGAFARKSGELEDRSPWFRLYETRRLG